MEEPAPYIPPWQDPPQRILAVALLTLATLSGSVKCPSSPPAKEAVRVTDPADPEISQTTSSTYGRIADIHDEIAAFMALEIASAASAAPAAPPSPEETARLAREASEQRILEQIEQLYARMQEKYGDLEESKTHVTSIITPTGKRLAVSIQLQGTLVNIYAGPKRYYVHNGPGILQLSVERFSLESRSDADAREWAREWVRATTVDELRGEFSGNGSAYGGTEDLAEVFHAFGLPPGMPAHEKAEIIFATLLEQL